MGMIRPIAGVVEEYQSNNNFDNNNNNFDVPQGDPLDSLLPEIKLRPNGLGQPDVNMRHIGMTLPAVFDNLADVIEFPTNDVNGIVPGGLGGGIGGPEGDIPFFWHIPRAGGATMNDVLGSCLQLTLASDAGGRDGHDKDKALDLRFLCELHSTSLFACLLASRFSKKSPMEFTEASCLEIFKASFVRQC
mmetsp:Transcript_66081/g.97877  ORF Transcript_66081/g.97877 Transcript_66081/m.97877 type:complete len:190 (+) Transcript_66081:1421-1990(+)